MSFKYYVLPEEREQMQKEAVKRAIVSIGGPVVFYEDWPGEEPRLTITDEALRAKRPFCNLVWKDVARKERCIQDHTERSATCIEPAIKICWCGVYNAVCPVKDEHDDGVTLTGGEFRVRERKAEAEERLEQFLETISPEQRETFREAWHQIPQVSEAEALGYKMRELQLAGWSYLHALKQRSDFRYSADLVTHDVAIALQALIAEIEVLKIELKDVFGIGQKWEKRFEVLIKLCEDHNAYLETRLGLDRPSYEYHSINKLLHKCLNSYVPIARDKGVTLQVDLEQEIDEEGQHKVLAVRMDQVALEQALLNVLDNAVKYSFSGTASHPRWVGVRGRPQAVRGVPGYNIVVSNLGVGIEGDELELVFEPGYQGRRRLDESRSGHGMGLTFVKECVERHGGTVAIRSQPQQRTGWLTTVYIWLPLQGPMVRRSKEA